MEDFIKAALKAGKAAAALLKSGDEELFLPQNVGFGGDVSLVADLKSEAIFCESLGGFGNIHSEECGFIDNHKAFTIVLDPLDGSDNFLSKIPYFGASVALCDQNDETKVGIVMNFCDESVILRSENALLKGRLGGDLSDFCPFGFAPGFAPQGFNASESAESAPRFAAQKPSESAESAPLESPRFARFAAPNAPAPKCGIFEKSYANPSIAAALSQNGVKFRSLGALALSLSLAHEVAFVLFRGKARIYDVKAADFITRGLYRAQSGETMLLSRDEATKNRITNILQGVNLWG